MNCYANIIIDISLEKLDRTFQYSVPIEMRQDIKPGMQVEIPFGRGNRLTTGYVLELTDQAAFDPAKLKEIVRLIPESITAPNQMLALASWIRTNYGGTMNQALKTVLPVKRKENEKERRVLELAVSLEEAGDILNELERKHHTARARLLQELIRNGRIPYETVTGKLNVTAAVIRAMEEKGILKVIRFRSYRNPLKSLKKNGKSYPLNEFQKSIVNDIIANQKEGDHRPCLLHGVTGSGKTEVYLELIASAIEQGKQSIVLIPEIALTFQTVMRFYNRFGERVSILNSRMSAGERYDQYERAGKGELDVIIGPRSALFTPFSNIGYIIIDEEHEASYKSETVPRYHARETAIFRASQCGGCVVLGSATPSVESYQRAKQGEFYLYEMKERIEHRPMPKVYVEDLREELRLGNRSVLSDRLRRLMEDRLQKKEQIMLFINRRGVAGFVSCRSCGHVIKCPHCDVSLSLHKNQRMVCHYCGYEEPAVKACPKCDSKMIGTFKAGTQKIESYLKEQFPQARVLRMDFDTTRQKDSYEKILSAFANREADILVGTQMIVKGHDFPYVTLVGVLAADLSLHVPDYRAAERTFQLLTQAAGRAGRGKYPGEVVIQTYQPEHYSIRTAKEQDYQAFFEQEISFRKLLRYPPVWNMLVVHIAAPVYEDAQWIADEMHEKIISYQKHDFDETDVTGQNMKEPYPVKPGRERACDQRRRIQVIGPADAGIAKINDIYKKVIYLKCADYSLLIKIKDLLEKELQSEQRYLKGTVQFDFNPMGGF